MKHTPKLGLIAVLCSSFAIAQDAPRDFGDLVPEPNFVITNEKTTLKDSADITNYEIKVSPEKDEFTYKVNSVRTPRGILKKNKFGLIVDRVDGKVSRLTSVDFASGHDDTGAQGLQTVAIGSDGKVDSLSNCFQEYSFGKFDLKKDKSAMKCVTINPEICSYMEDQKLDDMLVMEINNCSDLLGRLADHQGRLEELSKLDHQKNMESIKLKKRGILGKVAKGPENFYAFKPKTLEQVSNIAQSYGRAVSQCQYLKDKDYLRPKVEYKTIKAPEAEGGATQQ